MCIYIFQHTSKLFHIEIPLNKAPRWEEGCRTMQRFFCISTKRFAFKQLQVLSEQHLPHIIPFCLKNVKFIIWSAALKHWWIPASKSREFIVWVFIPLTSSFHRVYKCCFHHCWDTGQGKENEKKHFQVLFKNTLLLLTLQFQLEIMSKIQCSEKYQNPNIIWESFSSNRQRHHTSNPTL